VVGPLCGLIRNFRCGLARGGQDLVAEVGEVVDGLLDAAFGVSFLVVGGSGVLVEGAGGQDVPGGGQDGAFDRDQGRFTSDFRPGMALTSLALTNTTSNCSAST
jgi:hypothetical protein